MNLNVTKDQWNNETHAGTVFPGAENRQYAYQGERVSSSVSLTIHGWPPDNGAGKLNHELPAGKYSHYELILERFTGTAITVTLIGWRKDHVEQRRLTGKAVLHDKVQRTLQFGELCNFLFSEGQVFHDIEAFPKEVAEAMMKAYPTDPM